MAAAEGLSIGEKYGVFLSFRGADTRDGFTDFLCEFLKGVGVEAFMDDEELRAGESIEREIRKAIYDSKLFVPVFSKGFASSKWCLKEIAWMADCMEEFPGEKEMLPVFYDVDASDVKLKTDLYTKSLLEHVETYGHETVLRWWKALIKVPEVKGWNRRDFRGQGKLVRKMAEDISRWLELKHQILPVHLIGIDEKVQCIIEKLNCGSRDVRIVVIHGMGGIGKTTLAKSVFNKISSQFKRCSFLSKVRESAAGNGIVNLQNKLLQDMFRFSSYNFCDENDAMNRIQVLLKNEVVLVVLDDVSDKEQIRKLVGMGNWVGLGSRVIITPTNLNCIASIEEIKNGHAVLQEKVIYFYRMEEMGFDNALELLSLHAFDQRAPASGYEQLSHDILSFTKGIPWAIEVIGSRHLKGKGVAIWKEMLKKLEKVPNERLYQDILMSRYEALCDEEKEIFLDITFFFAGHDKSTASYYWEARGLYPEMSVDTLVSYDLVEIDHSNKLLMHDLLRYLGREVVRQQSIEDLGRRSRICNEDAKRLQCKGQGTEYVKALKLDSTHAHNFTPSQLLGLSDLQFLELCGGNLIWKFGENCLSKLVWLSWRDCPLDFRWTNFCFENLVVLRLSESEITDTGAGWEQLKTVISLKVLELEGLNWIAVPNLAAFSSLERLVVRHCKSLVRIDPSIGNLECLDSLEMINSFSWPFDLNHYERVFHMPSSICNLKALSRLIIVGFELRQLPENIGELKGLKVMRIEGCNSLRNLPDSIGDLESLCELRLHHAGITKLPESIGKLGNLNVLDVSRNRLRGLPATIGALYRLEVLNASNNRYWQGKIPIEFGSLKSLKYLDLSCTEIRGLPSSIHQLSRLESLSLECCNKIRELPDLSTGLTKLRISCRSLKSAPKLSRVTNLVDLFLCNGGNKQVLTWSVSDYLSVGLDQLSQLRNLWLSCRNPLVVSLLPSGLNSLTLYHSTSLSSWERLSNLEGLSRLSLLESSATEIRLDGLESLKNLTQLEIKRCEFLERIHDISRLQKLQSLALLNCPKLAEIGGLTQLLESLQHLRIWSCDSIRCLPDRSGTESPSELRLVVHGCSKLRDFRGPYNSYSQGGRKRKEMK